MQDAPDALPGLRADGHDRREIEERHLGVDLRAGPREARIDPYYLDVILSDYYTKGDIGGALDFLREVNEARGEEEGVKGIVTKYFAIIPPDEQIGFLEEQLAEDPENVEVIMQLFKIYRQENYQAEMMELAPRLRQLDPTPDVLRTLMPSGSPTFSRFQTTAATRGDGGTTWLTTRWRGPGPRRPPTGALRRLGGTRWSGRERPLAGHRPALLGRRAAARGPERRRPADVVRGRSSGAPADGG